MIKHVGKHNQKKVVLLFREVPGEDHMCLVTYSEALPRLYHDEVMKVLESAAGQQSTNLSDALFRNIMADGRNSLEALHRDGFIKKVPCNQVIVTPNAKSTIRLDELNKILKEMAQGEEAVKRLAELDNNRGFTDKPRKKNSSTRAGDVGDPVSQVAESAPDVLSDRDLAMQRVRQAENMRADATRLLKEAESLMTEAAELDPTIHDNQQKKKGRTKVTKS